MINCCACCRQENIKIITFQNCEQVQMFMRISQEYNQLIRTQQIILRESLEIILNKSNNLESVLSQIMNDQISNFLSPVFHQFTLLNERVSNLEEQNQYLRSQIQKEQLKIHNLPNLYRSCHRQQQIRVKKYKNVQLENIEEQSDSSMYNMHEQLNVLSQQIEKLNKQLETAKQKSIKTEQKYKQQIFCLKNQIRSLEEGKNYDSFKINSADLDVEYSLKEKYLIYDVYEQIRRLKKQNNELRSAVYNGFKMLHKYIKSQITYFYDHKIMRENIYVLKSLHDYQQYKQFLNTGNEEKIHHDNLKTQVNPQISKFKKRPISLKKKYKVLHSENVNFENRIIQMFNGHH